MYNGKLRPYQQEGLFQVIKNKSNLVAWDLGLGKTHLSMAYCEGVKHLNKQNVLILAPSAIIYQWQEEINKFTDSKVTVINGIRKKRRLQWQEESYYYITNYEKLRTDAQIFQKLWGVVILDECTKIKSPKAQITNKAYQIRAIKKIGLSGTPIHNTPSDLYSIVNFLYPNLMGNWWQFANRYIEFEQRQINGRGFNEIVGFKNLDELHNKIKMFFIRKKKEDVLKELPPVIYETLSCSMNRNQQQVYEQIIQEIIAIQESENTLHLFTALKLLSNHPTLLKETKGEKIKCFSSLVNDTSSDKLKTLLDFIEENKDKKIVVFSQYTKMLDIILEELGKKNYNAISFRGDLSKEINNANLHAFQNEPDMKILLSSDAGAYGVNLQCASIIINYDLPYSVAVFYQRIGRLHRIGQSNSVIVINIVTQSSIETKVLKILQNKQQMIDQIIDGKKEMNIFNEILVEMRR